MKIIAYLVSMGLMLTLLGCGTSVPTKETPDSASSMMVTSPPLSSKNEPEISMSEFNQIKNGMTYEQVTDIIGDPGELIAETGTSGDQFHTVTYEFKGVGESIWNSAFAQLIFQDGQLNTKAQKGIKKFTDEKIKSPGN